MKNSFLLIVIPFQLFLPVIYGQASYPLKTAYDRVRDETVLSASSPIHLAIGEECGLKHADEYHRFVMTYQCPGDVSGCPKGTLVMTFSFCTSSWTFQAVQVAILADGKRLVLPRSEHSGKVRSAFVLEDAVGVEVPVTAAGELAASRKIEVKLRDYYYELSSANMSSLRDVWERIR